MRRIRCARPILGKERGARCLLLARTEIWPETANCVECRGIAWARLSLVNSSWAGAMCSPAEERGEICASRRPHHPKNHRERRDRRHGVQFRKVDLIQVGRRGCQRKLVVARLPEAGPRKSAFPGGVDGEARAIHSFPVEIRRNMNTLQACRSRGGHIQGGQEGNSEEGRRRG